MNREELERRTLEFSKVLAKVLQELPRNPINDKLIRQVIASGTSVGANYKEANTAESPRDFQHKMNISFKEAEETRYWLDILISVNPTHINNLSSLRKESDEFARIFGKAVTTCKINAKLIKSNAKSKMQNAN